MTEPTFSILIPTAGGGDIPHLLHSISTQKLLPEDEVIIIGDGARPMVRASIESVVSTGIFPCTLRYLESERTNDFGHTQLNETMEEAKADYILVQDDDDIFLPRSFEVIRRALSDTPPPRRVPHLFRFYTNDHWLVWDPKDGHRVEETLIGSHNLITPNDKDKLGRFTPRYRGDFDWVKSTLSFYPETHWEWHREIITRQRPNRTVLDWPTDGREIGAIFPDVPLPISGLWGWRFTDREIPNSPSVGHAILWIDRGSGSIYFDFSLAPEAVGRGFLRWIAQHAIDACQGDAFYGGKSDPQKDAILEELGAHKGVLTWP